MIVKRQTQPNNNTSEQKWILHQITLNIIIIIELMAAHIPHILALCYNRLVCFVGNKVKCSTRISIEMKRFFGADICTMCWYQWNSAIILHYDKCQCEYCARPEFLKLKKRTQENCRHYCEKWLLVSILRMHSYFLKRKKEIIWHRLRQLLYPERHDFCPSGQTICFYRIHHYGYGMALSCNVFISC